MRSWRLGRWQTSFPRRKGGRGEPHTATCEEDGASALQHRRRSPHRQHSRSVRRRATRSPACGAQPGGLDKSTWRSGHASVPLGRAPRQLPFQRQAAPRGAAARPGLGKGSEAKRRGTTAAHGGSYGEKSACTAPGPRRASAIHKAAGGSPRAVRRRPRDLHARPPRGVGPGRCGVRVGGQGGGARRSGGEGSDERGTFACGFDGPASAGARARVGRDDVGPGPARAPRSRAAQGQRGPARGAARCAGGRGAGVSLGRKKEWRGSV
jgi:hypothetical protein